MNKIQQAVNGNERPQKCERNAQTASSGMVINLPLWQSIGCGTEIVRIVLRSNKFRL